ncbi:TonB-dependent receptor [Flavivirga spongiicola]|uniref:TonB-dependent receptor n=1 Tax=Flavivirga spongiicola TaxID=421621 RepID=A0ABU7XZC8_9FLAO|nr:TonB-dependent receptor [Flavivirga sp. MEBiC05379]MDO5981144.1 TonB-dependent receptor [Flavivirga sp. MEBiC05379]
MIFILIINYSLGLNAQNTENQKIKLTHFLSKLSEEHQVFFTYDVDLLNNINIDANQLNNTDLQLIIDSLRAKTNLHFDNLGNNYYVIYNDSEKGKASLENAKKRLNETIATLSNSNGFTNFTMKGKVVNIFNEPLAEANIIENGSINGTTTDIHGNFTLQTNSINNLFITVSYVGYASKVIAVQNENDITIVLEPEESLKEVQIVGSRNANRSVLDTPSVIDVVQLEEAIKRTGQIEINQILQFVIPSFNASKQSGADGSDHIVPATLRGLGPDQTLILINGKRRHQSSLINLYGTRGRGNSGTDLNAIPASAIEKIEVLRDGASAQYGSDAIAGVINIVLKDDIDTFNGNITYGFNNANVKGDFRNSTSGIDGNTMKLSGNYGMKILDDGFVNITTEYLSKDKTLRPGADFREKYGEAGLNEYSIFINTEIPINDHSNFYAFGGYSCRNSESYAFTRFADSPRNVLEIYPNGFNPLITAKIKDNSISAGFKTKFNGWNIDINNTFGRNNFQYFIKETLNATLLFNSPTSFNAGGHILNQNTTDADFTRFYKTIFNGVNIAFGTEYRIENFKIFAGEPGSYAAFDINKNMVDQNTAPEDLVMLNGSLRPRGSQGFPGYAPENKVDQTRSNLALYIDTEFDFTNKFMFGIAGRYEKYSDFGNTFNIKLSSRYKASDNFNMRSAFSSGFRAPSLAQFYYNLKFTNFIGGEPSESLLELNDSPVTRSFGISNLIEEKALNGSLGFTAKMKNFKVSLDAYYVNIKDRIILTGNFDASNLNLNVNDVQFFANGVDTSTMGLDVILTWKKSIANNFFSMSFAGNINNMTIDKIKNRALHEETFFSKRDQHFLLASAPKSKFNLNLNYSNKKFNTNLTLTSFNKVTLIDWQIDMPLITEDPNSEYIDEADRLQKATDTYTPKLTTDINIGYALTKKMALRLGANNLFNIYPSVQQNNWTDSGGYWDSVQMGTSGSFLYSNISYKF